MKLQLLYVFIFDSTQTTPNAKKKRKKLHLSILPYYRKLTYHKIKAVGLYPCWFCERLEPCEIGVTIVAFTTEGLAEVELKNLSILNSTPNRSTTDPCCVNYIFLCKRLCWYVYVKGIFLFKFFIVWFFNGKSQIYENQTFSIIIFLYL